MSLELAASHHGLMGIAKQSAQTLAMFEIAVGKTHRASAVISSPALAFAPGR